MRNAPRTGIFSSIALIGLLAGCSVYGPEPTFRGVRDASTGQAVPGVGVLNSGDQGSGKITTVFVQPDMVQGGYRPLYGADGPGTFQTFTEGGLSGIAQGAGLGLGLGLARPAVTALSNIGNSRATGGSATGGIGLGGAGGAGGVGLGGAGGSASARARGGNASLNAHLSNSQLQAQSQHQNATATSDAAATTGPVSASASGGGGGVIPNGTVLHTLPGGNFLVDPTVNVSQ